MKLFYLAPRIDQYAKSNKSTSMCVVVVAGTSRYIDAKGQFKITRICYECVRFYLG